MNEITQPKSVALLTVATGDYFEYWADLVSEFKPKYDRDISVAFHLFTDSPSKAEKYKAENPQKNIYWHEIDNLPWPLITLNRYDIYLKFKNQITEDFLIHIDADMKIMPNFVEEFIRGSTDSRISFVQHPGFWMPSSPLGLIFFWRSPRALLLRIASYLKRSSFGSWERRVESSGFVEPEFQKVYVCGAVCGGPRSKFFWMCEGVSSLVRRDRENGILAIWHDESYVNAWASVNQFELLEASFCKVLTYRYLNHMKTFAIAIDKGFSKDNEDKK